VAAYDVNGYESEAVKAARTVIHLNDGWNMVSIPVIQADTAVDYALESVFGLYDFVETFDGQDDTWHSLAGDLTHVDHTQGLWVHMAAPGDLMAAGRVPTLTPIQLNASGSGWNFVGFPAFVPVSPETAFGTLWDTGQVDAVEYFNGSTWLQLKDVRPSYINDLGLMGPPQAYWVHVTLDCVWTLTN